jgi:hypothetical protein
MNVVAADAVHPLVNFRQNTPLALSKLFTIGQKQK